MTRSDYENFILQVVTLRTNLKAYANSSAPADMRSEMKYAVESTASIIDTLNKIEAWRQHRENAKP